MMRNRSAWALVLVFAGVSGCGGGIEEPDATVAAPDAGSDGGSAACHGQADGTECGTGRVCTAGACADSRCGDAIVDARSEECDDGNAQAFDGCESTCRFTCRDATTCDDGEPCNGGETCNASHTCAIGAPLGDGIVCATASVTDGVCRMQRCILRTCGNGTVDPGEQCDDGNDVGGDGCEVDCRTTCVDPPPETCNGADDDCDMRIDEDVSTICFTDEDGDGFAAALATSMTICGLCPAMFTSRLPMDVASIDCNDMNSAINPGVDEMCSFPAVDQNCNGLGDEGYVQCWPDTDMDGYAPVGAVPLAAACPQPGGFGGCATGYTSRDPSVAGNADCGATSASTHPGASDTCRDRVDNDCDGMVDNGGPEDRMYYVDLDGDGYGAGSQVPVTVDRCTSTTTAPAGYAISAGDCSDQDSTAHPRSTGDNVAFALCPDPAQSRCMLGSRWYCQSGAACDTSDPPATMSFDYDCDGTEERASSAAGSVCVVTGCTATCAVTLTGNCYTGTPACGSTVPVCDCTGACGSCTQTASATTRALRCF